MIKKILFAFITINLSSCAMYEKHEPLIISHRGAKMDNPENTVVGFKKSILSGASGLEMDIQVTKDGVPVLYHPEDLQHHTNCSGKISDITYTKLQKCKIKYKEFELPIPKLHEAIRVSKNHFLILDIKSPDVENVIEPTISVLRYKKALDRAVFYSTNKMHNEYLKSKYPRVKRFQDRDSTREILLNFKINGICKGDIKEDYLAFEMYKDKLYVLEKLTIGKYETTITNVNLINKKSIECIRSLRPDVLIFVFGINSQALYEEARNLDIDGIISDSMKFTSH